MRLDSDVSYNDVDTTQCITDWTPEDPCGPEICKNNGICRIDMADYSGRIVPGDDRLFC